MTLKKHKVKKQSIWIESLKEFGLCFSFLFIVIGIPFGIGLLSVFKSFWFLLLIIPYFYFIIVFINFLDGGGSTNEA